MACELAGVSRGPVIRGTNPYHHLEENASERTVVLAAAPKAGRLVFEGQLPTGRGKERGALVRLWMETHYDSEVEYFDFDGVSIVAPTPETQERINHDLGPRPAEWKEHCPRRNRSSL